MKKNKQLDIEKHLTKNNQYEDFPMETENYNPLTGEVRTNRLNEVIFVKEKRKNGTRRIQQDFSNCPTMAEQHTAHLTDLNYLIAKYKPDELTQYLIARSQHRTEIIGHDFTQEPSLQEGLNAVVESKKAFEELPDEVRYNFRNHLEFLKFIDNPANEEKMIKLGLLKPKDLEKLKLPDSTETAQTTKTTTKEKDKE